MAAAAFQHGGGELVGVRGVAAVQPRPVDVVEVGRRRVAVDPGSGVVFRIVKICHAVPDLFPNSFARRFDDSAEPGSEHLVIHRLKDFIFPGGKSRAPQQVAVARGVDEHPCPDRAAPGFVLDDRRRDFVSLADSRDARALQKNADAVFADEGIQFHGHLRAVEIGKPAAVAVRSLAHHPAFPEPVKQLRSQPSDNLRLPGCVVQRMPLIHLGRCRHPSQQDVLFDQRDAQSEPCGAHGGKNPGA